MKLAILLPVGSEAQASMQAALDRHLAAKRLYRQVKELDTGSASPGATADAGSPRSTEPALSPQPPAIVAWDLTLRCPVCNSNVDGSVRKYHCFQCARRGQ